MDKMNEMEHINHKEKTGRNHDREAVKVLVVRRVDF